MNDIKFKARSTTTNDFVFWDLSAVNYCQETICISTGIKDKNGLDLYTNDIIRCINHYDNKTPVYIYHRIVYSDKYKGFIAVYMDNKDDESLLTGGNVQLFVYLINEKEFEIVGNIYDTKSYTDDTI